ncbi:unnamed protein product, partial [Musa banksii]
PTSACPAPLPGTVRRLPERSPPSSGFNPSALLLSVGPQDLSHCSGLNPDFHGYGHLSSLRELEASNNYGNLEINCPSTTAICGDNFLQSTQLLSPHCRPSRADFGRSK